MGEWKVCPQDPWYIECDASDYSSIGISHSGKIKAIAVGFGDEDYSDEIVAALNSHDALIEERDRLRAALEKIADLSAPPSLGDGLFAITSARAVLKGDGQ